MIALGENPCQFYQIIFYIVVPYLNFYLDALVQLQRYVCCLLCDMYTVLRLVGSMQYSAGMLSIKYRAAILWSIWFYLYYIHGHNFLITRKNFLKADFCLYPMDYMVVVPGLLGCTTIILQYMQDCCIHSSSGQETLYY